jgi:Big-like domain-containing protein
MSFEVGPLIRAREQRRGGARLRWAPMLRVPLAGVSRRCLVIAIMAGALGTGVPAAAAQGGADSSSGTLGLEVHAVVSPSASALSQARSAKKRCAGLKGDKLRRCRAIAKCKKLKGKKRKRCLAKARKIGVKKKQQPPIQPPKAQPPLVQPPKAQPPLVQPPANRAPFWPSPVQFSGSTQFQYDPTTGYLIGATTTINVLTPAIDPDGDPLTYTWTASNGSITANGLSATWTRVIELGRPKPGSVTVTASDGKGGAAPFVFR